MALPIRSKNTYIASPNRQCSANPTACCPSREARRPATQVYELIGCCREPLLAPYLYLIGQALQACRHQQQPPSDLWAARLARELPHCGGPLQVFPHPRLFVEHCKAPTNISPGRRTDVTGPGSLLILRFCLPVAWVPKRSRDRRSFMVNDGVSGSRRSRHPSARAGAGRAGRLPSLGARLGVH